MNRMWGSLPGWRPAPAPASECVALLDENARQAQRAGDKLINLLLRRDLRISYRGDIERPLKEIFGGREFEPVRDRLDRIHGQIRSGRLFVATHMHAGDGNVHTNIPVNSNDYVMLHEAERIVDRVMQLAKMLNGVISGEHGIGLEKKGFLDKSMDSTAIRISKEIKAFLDPHGVMNPDKIWT